MRGPARKYQPQFAPEAPEKARELVRTHTAPQSHVQRAKLALLLAEHPSVTSVEAGRLVGWHPQTVPKWRRRWERVGFTLEDRPRPGRPPRLSPS